MYSRSHIYSKCCCLLFGLVSWTALLSGSHAHLSLRAEGDWGGGDKMNLKIQVYIRGSIKFGPGLFFVFIYFLALVWLICDVITLRLLGVAFVNLGKVVLCWASDVLHTKNKFREQFVSFPVCSHFHSELLQKTSPVCNSDASRRRSCLNQGYTVAAWYSQRAQRFRNWMFPSSGEILGSVCRVTELYCVYITQLYRCPSVFFPWGQKQVSYPKPCVLKEYSTVDKVYRRFDLECTAVIMGWWANSPILHYWLPRIK
jgi:hypothetical protein